MADSKISALPASTTPLAGSEVLPIVQSSATKQVSVANLTAGRAVSAASLALTTALPTTSGGTALTSFTNKGVVYASSASVLATGSALEFDGTNFGVGTGGNAMNHQSVIYKGGANAVYQQIGNGATGLGATQGIRLGLTAAGASELYASTSFTCYVDGSSAYSISTALEITVTAGNLVIGTAGKGISLPGGITWTSGAGSPEGVVTAPIGSLYSRSDGGILTSFYVKQSGAGNTGWAAK